MILFIKMENRDLVEVVLDQDHLTLFITTQEGMQGPGLVEKCALLNLIRERT